jgi:hypothetical protein
MNYSKCSGSAPWTAGPDPSPRPTFCRARRAAVDRWLPCKPFYFFFSFLFFFCLPRPGLRSRRCGHPLLPSPPDIPSWHPRPRASQSRFSARRRALNPAPAPAPRHPALRFFLGRNLARMTRGYEGLIFYLSPGAREDVSIGASSPFCRRPGPFLRGAAGRWAALL